MLTLMEICLTYSVILDEADRVIPYIYAKKTVSSQTFYVYVYISDVFGRLIDITPIIAQELRMKVSTAKDTKDSLIIHGFALDRFANLITMLNVGYSKLGGYDKSVFSGYYRQVTKGDIERRAYKNIKVLPPHKDFDSSLWKLSWNVFKTYIKDEIPVEELYDRLYRRDTYAPSTQLFGTVYYATKKALLGVTKG